MVKFAVLSIKDIINRLIALIFTCAIMYMVCMIFMQTFNNIDVFKRYIAYNIPIYEKNTKQSALDIFMKYIISSEVFLIKDNGYIPTNSNHIQDVVEPNDVDNNNMEQNVSSIPIGATDLKISDVNNKNYNIGNNINNVSIKNKTTYTLDYTKMINEKLNLFNQNKMPTILIIHTHGSESYTGVEHTDYFRNENIDLNVVRVGEELANILKNSGYDVIHDTRLYDYPTYSGSYTRTLSSIQQYVKDNTNTQIVLDIHRDAMASDENFAPSTEIDGNRISQIMIIAGTNEGGLSHPNWKENLKLALQLYNTAYQVYPDIFRNLTITKSRYNQHATNGSLILEVGATGNTLDESILSMRYFAKILDETLKNNWEDKNG